jgi:biotin carboxylase
MMTVGEQEAPVGVLPRVALFPPEPFPPLFEVLVASRDLCQILWVVGWPPDRPTAVVHRRFGEVVDVSGLGFQEAVAKIESLRPDGVAVLSDEPIEIAAVVAERLNLRFHSVETARLLSDKMAQREALGAAGLAVPRFGALRLGDTDVDVPFPAVLKPRAGAGSRDTYKVESNQEIAEILASCDPREEFILEEWLSDSNHQRRFAADLVSVETLVREGDVRHLMVTGRFPFALPFRETGSFMPSDLGDGDKDAVREVATAAIHALGITNGIIHTEVKMTSEGARLVEVNGRLGGSISGLMTKIGGPSMTRLVFQVALGVDVGVLPEVNPSSIAFYRLLVGPIGATKVTAVEHLDDVRTMPGVEEVHLNKQPGDQVNARTSAYIDNTVRVDGLVHSYEELLDLMDGIDATLTLSFS